MKGLFLIVVILLLVGFSKSYQAKQQRQFLADTARQYELGRFDNTIIQAKKTIKEYGNR